MRFEPMVRTTVIVASALACASGAAQAQTPGPDSAPAQARPGAIEEPLSETLAALDRLRAEPPSGLSDPPRSPAPAATSLPVLASDDPAGRALSALAAQQDADADRILQLQEAALARSNARIRAVQPVN